MGNQSTKYITRDEGLAQEMQAGKNMKKAEKIQRVINLKRMKEGMAQTLCISAYDLLKLTTKSYLDQVWAQGSPRTADSAGEDAARGDTGTGSAVPLAGTPTGCRHGRFDVRSRTKQNDLQADRKLN